MTCAITGVGLVAGLGRDAETVWQRVRRGESAFAPMSAMEQPLPAGKDGGQAVDLPADYAPELPREARYLRWTIEAALRDASLFSDRPYADDRCAVMLGTTLHGMRAAGSFLRSDDAATLATFLAGDTARLATAGLGLSGSSATTCSACSSSLGAVALGVTMLARGEADVVIAGGYDTISEYAWAGFNALRLISDPPLRPFARGRCGMKLAEGYGIVVLERVADVERRGARARAIVAGWGESADAFHLTRPHPAGEGALAAMRQAIDRAGVTVGDVGLIAAHATGTPDNDSSEAAAIGSLLVDLPPGAASPSVVGFKSHLGHTLGGAGAVELILSSLALRDGIIPPTANVAAADVEYPSLPVATAAERAVPLRHTLTTSLGFGGANTCIVLRAAELATTRRGTTFSLASIDRDGEEAVITGIGTVVPGAIGNEAFLRLCDDVRGSARRRTIDDAEIEAHVNARRTRRMSPYVKLSLCAATLACGDARVLDNAAWLESASAILGTTHGSSGYSLEYYSQIVREGVASANPMLFAEGVPNAAAAQLSLMLGLRGACQTIIGTRTAGLDALRFAAARIATGVVDCVIVCAAEEAHDVIDGAYGRRDQSSRSISAAVAFVLESRRSLEARHGSLNYGTVGRGWSRTADADTRRQLWRVARGEATRARLPFRLGGDAFSVSPMLALASSLLGPERSPCDAAANHSVLAVDAAGPITRVDVNASRVAFQPQTISR